MALWDKVDLLARCKFYAQRPATDESMADADWYSLLTEAQAEVYTMLAAHGMQALYGAPTQLTTTDSKTFTFGTVASANIVPIGQVEIRRTRTGPLMVPCSEWETGGDFVMEGDKIRIPGNRTLSPAPYARFITPPEAIDASNDAALIPRHARILLVYRACEKWARRGGFRDPSYFIDLFTKAWSGDPNVPGDVGLLGLYKTQFAFSGAVGVSGSPRRWWDSIRVD